MQHNLTPDRQNNIDTSNTLSEDALRAKTGRSSDLEDFSSSTPAKRSRTPTISSKSGSDQAIQSIKMTRSTVESDKASSGMASPIKSVQSCTSESFSIQTPCTSPEKQQAQSQGNQSSTSSRSNSISAVIEKGKKLILPNINFASGLTLPKPWTRNGSTSSDVDLSLIKRLHAEELEAILPESLVLDLRSALQFAQGRFKGSINVTVPTTLIKRNTFTLDKVEEMLALESDRLNFTLWREKKYIVVFPGDAHPTQIPINAQGLFSKFQRADYQGTLCYLGGTFESIGRVTEGLIEKTPLREGADEKAGLAKPTLATSALVQPAILPSTAFLTSTTIHARTDDQSLTVRSAANPFFDNIRQNIELQNGMSEERHHLDVPQHVRAKSQSLPPYLRRLVNIASDQSALELAQHFHDLEEAEKTRLQDVLLWHCNQDRPGAKNWVNAAQEEELRKYSISAGVELGVKNRYRNIFPYAHTRVSLKSPCDRDGSDYVNASFIDIPRDDTRSGVANHAYIATQAPTTQSCDAFWSMVWEQQTTLIVMLTRLRENGQEKCCSYWKLPPSSRFTVDLCEQDGTDPDECAESQVDPFHSLRQPTSPSKEIPSIITRKFRLRHKKHRDKPDLVITQLQFTAWPDYDIPLGEESMLRLLTKTRSLQAIDSERRTIVHCSAGVGRTGGFIAIDLAMRRAEANRRRGPCTPSLMDAPSRMKNSISRQHNSRIGRRGSVISSLTDSMTPSEASSESSDMDKADQPSEHFEKPRDDIQEIITMLRQQRMSMVATLRQYVYVYNAVIAGIYSEIQNEEETFVQDMQAQSGITCAHNNAE